MLEDIADDYAAYKRPLLAQGFWACVIHRLGSRADRLRIAPVRWVGKALHIGFIKMSEIFFGIYIGQHAKIGRRFVIDHFGGVIIHSNARIGDDVRIRQNVTIGNKLLTRPMDVPTIGNRVQIGVGAVLLGAIQIGDDAVIGANAVVLCDVPAGFMAVGVPARLRPLRPPMSDNVVYIPDGTAGLNEVDMRPEPSAWMNGRGGKETA